MQRLRLKADGRIVEVLDGREAPLVPDMPGDTPSRKTSTTPVVRDLRLRAKLTPSRVRLTPRRSSRDHTQLGARQAFAARSGACAADRDRSRARYGFRGTCAPVLTGHDVKVPPCAVLGNAACAAQDGELSGIQERC